MAGTEAPGTTFRRDAETALRDYWGDHSVFAQGWEKIEPMEHFLVTWGYLALFVPRSLVVASRRFGVAIAYGGALASGQLITTAP